MEHELVECYRHYYAGQGSFRVALDDNQETGSPRLQLPTSAIGTYLQAKLQSKRGAAHNTKLEDVRGPTAADSPSRRQSAAVVPRRRATSFAARLQHESDLDELERRASTPSR
ncbi:hypothetical protein PHMEG_00018771 [Phytophthora megakarya]|uniref:Uncharacterized protein n=1 Tax=Phytophthora megakarya TaxID=4795 RepID=A0A225VT88_9STRA|nr:hypothetical protein PHMEG_00018771 [Phytophthora megakarya]